MRKGLCSDLIVIWMNLGISLILLWWSQGNLFKLIFTYIRVMGFMNIGANMGAIRAVRLLRPLRSINKVKGIRVIVTAFIASMPPLMNVGIFLIFIVILFGTFGLHLFYGMHEWRCRLTEKPLPNGTWPLLEDNFELCYPSKNNCPANSFCGAPIEYDLPWDWEETNYYEF